MSTIMFLICTYWHGHHSFVQMSTGMGPPVWICQECLHTVKELPHYEVLQ